MRVFFKDMESTDIKLVASDMDGTLLNSQAEIAPEFFPIYERMRKHNIKFVAASGRQIHNMRIKFTGIEDEIYFAAENGAYLTKGGKELLSLELTHSEICEFLEIARKIPNSYIVVSAKKYAYIENPDPVFLARLTSYSGYLKPVDDISKVKDDTFFKFTVCDLTNPSTNSLPHFIHLRSNYQVKVSGIKWMDLTHKDADKGKTLSLIQKMEGISPSQTVAFGDYLNDLEMLKNSHFSYAMENAHQEVKNIAKFKTFSNDEKGVTKALDKIIPR